MFQGLTGGGGGLSAWRLLSIPQNAPSIRLCKVAKMAFYSSLFQKVPPRESKDQKTLLAFVDSSLFHFICLSPRSHLSWIHSFLSQLHRNKLEAPEAPPPLTVVGRGI